MGDGVRKYSVEISPQAQKAMDRLDAKIRERIDEWIEKNLEDCENPRLFGLALKGNLKGNWRYRVGKYRIVAEI